MVATSLPEPARRVIAATACTSLADGIRQTAMPLLAAAATRDPLWISATFVAGQLPWLVLGLWAGGLADRVERTRLLRVAIAARTTVLLALAVLAAFDIVPIALVVLAAFLLGIGEVLSDTVAASLLPTLVDDHLLERANSRLVATEIAGNELLGPALGGVLFAAGASLPFLTNAGLLSTALLFLAAVPLMAPSRPRGGPLSTPGLAAGWRRLREHRLLRTITWSSAVLAAIDAAWFALLVVIAERDLSLGAAGFGVLLAVGALGGLLGAAAADRLPAAPIWLTTSTVMASMGVVLVAFAVAPSRALGGAAMIVTSAGFAVWNVVVATARQRATPPDLFGRVTAAYRLVLVVAAIGGAATGGLVASRSGTGVTVGLAGLLLVAAAPLVAIAFGRERDDR